MPRSSASKKSVAAGERDRPDVARRRAQWTKYQDRIEPERLVFIDETWTRTDMAPLRGWAPRGERLTAKVPHGRWKTMNLPGSAASRPDRRSVVYRRADRRRQLSCLRRESPPADTATRRRRHHGQSRQPQRQGCASAHSLCRRQTLLPAQILARPEPYRTGLCQAQTSSQESCRPNRRGSMCSHRRSAQCLLTR
jgi:hypothetical protein